MKLIVHIPLYFNVELTACGFRTMQCPNLTTKPDEVTCKRCKRSVENAPYEYHTANTPGRIVNT